MLRLPVSSSEALTLAQMALTQRKHSAAFVNTDAAASQLALAVLLFALPAAEEPIARERGVKSLVVRLLCVHVITTKAGGGGSPPPLVVFLDAPAAYRLSSVSSRLITEKFGFQGLFSQFFFLFFLLISNFFVIFDAHGSGGSTRLRFKGV